MTLHRPPDNPDDPAALTPSTSKNELLIRFAQPPPDYPESLLPALQDYLRAELDEPELTFSWVHPPGDTPSIYDNYGVFRNLKRSPGDDAHQIIDLIVKFNHLNGQTGTREVEALHGVGDRPKLFVDEAPGAFKTDVPHVLGYKGQGVKLGIIDRIWDTAVVGKMILGTTVEDHREGVGPCKDKPDPKYNEWIAHSTAALSLIGVLNDIDATGIRGMVPDVDKLIAFSSFTDDHGRCVEDWPGAIRKAITQAGLGYGDILLLEGQVYYDPTQEGGLLPLEHDPAIFKAIQSAVKDGIIVIEPAGNWGIELDAAKLSGLQNLGWLDAPSGAIMVGALDSREEEILAGTNFGKRVDLYAWGSMIKTASVGTAASTSYTYGNTSGAAALIAGAVALAQSVIIKEWQKPVNGIDMLKLLKSTGTHKTVKINATETRQVCMPDLERFLKEVSRHS